MSTAIRTRIVKIGNSQGVRIPKLLLEQSGIHTEVEIEVEGDHKNNTVSGKLSVFRPERETSAAILIMERIHWLSAIYRFVNNC